MLTLNLEKGDSKFHMMEARTFNFKNVDKKRGRKENSEPLFYVRQMSYKLSHALPGTSIKHRHDTNVL